MSSWSWIKSVKLLPGFSTSGEDHDYFSFAQLHIVLFVILIVSVFVYMFVFVFDFLLVLSCLHITLTTCLNGDKSLAVLYGSIVQQCLRWMPDAKKPVVQSSVGSFLRNLGRGSWEWKPVTKTLRLLPIRPVTGQ